MTRAFNFRQLDIRFGCALICFFIRPDLLAAQNLVVQQPTFGVSIDAKGVLTSKAFPGGPDLVLTRVAAAKARLGDKLFQPSRTRYVSLRRLDRAIASRIRDGLQPTEEMLRMAGLLRVEYVFALPDQKDIVLAGPAEGWIESPAGHIVGIKSGLPTIHLQDLTTALHVFKPGRPIDQWVGCSIGPGPGAMKRLQEFNRTIPRSIPSGTEEAHAQRILEGTIKSLGMAGVVTFGIDSDTHLARRMIEADYRMKSICIGKDPPPVPLKTFHNQIKAPPRTIMQRWWLVPNYERIGIAADRLSAKLVGAGVKLLTENYQRDKKGRMVKSKQKPSAASLAYTKSFTSNFEKLALMSSSFGQLRNGIDLLVIAAFLRSEDLYKKTGYSPDWIDNRKIEFGNDSKNQKRALPDQFQMEWSTIFTLAGGGVSIVPSTAFAKENLLNVDPKNLKRFRPDGKKKESWWWDR